MKLTALIILNFNNFEDTINCIESVERYNTAPIKYIVVDNGSTRKEAAAALDKYMSERFGARYAKYHDGERVPAGVLPYATLLVSETNYGSARGNNKGLALVQEDPTVDDILILNNDILFIDDIIPELISIRDSLPDCGIISPLLLKRDCQAIDYNCARRAIGVGDLVKSHLMHYFVRMCGSTDEQFMRKRYLLLDPEVSREGLLPIDLPSGSCMLIDKRLFQSIGFFDPGTFLYYEEDILYRKLIEVGRNNYLAGNLRCIHLGAASTNQKSTPVTLRANRESERYYVRKFSGASKLMIFAHGISLRLFWLTLKLQKKVCPAGLTRKDYL